MTHFKRKTINLKRLCIEYNKIKYYTHINVEINLFSRAFSYVVSIGEPHFKPTEHGSPQTREQPSLTHRHVRLLHLLSPNTLFIRGI